MTVPSPAPRPSPTQPLPRRLTLITLPLMIGLVYNAISLLTIPFSGPTLNELMSEYEKALGQPLPELTPAMMQVSLWLAFFLSAALVLWLYFTRRAVVEGKQWGRVSALVIAVLSLLLFPFGTVLGVIMLLGLFDHEVTAYLTR